MKTERIDPTTDPRWPALNLRMAGGVFNSPAWFSVLYDTYGFEVEACLVKDVENPVAGLAFVAIDDFMDPRVVTLPFSDFCDPLVETADHWRVIGDELDLTRRRFQIRYLGREWLDPHLGLEQSGRARWHGMDLTRPLDEIRDSIDPAARRSVRKAESLGVTVRAAESLEDVRIFYEMHRDIRRFKYRMLAQPFRFFEAIWNRFLSAGAGTLLLAEYRGRAVGGVLFLEWDGVLYYKFNASSLDSLEVRPNDLIIWNAIGLAHGRGLRLLDFGLSDWDQEGLVRFKRKYATDEKTIRTFRHLPSGTPTRQEQEIRRLFGRLTAELIGEGVPSTAAERGGDLLYRYFT